MHLELVTCCGRWGLQYGKDNRNSTSAVYNSPSGFVAWECVCIGSILSTVEFVWHPSSSCYCPQLKSISPGNVQLVSKHTKTGNCVWFFEVILKFRDAFAERSKVKSSPFL